MRLAASPLVVRQPANRTRRSWQGLGRAATSLVLVIVGVLCFLSENDEGTSGGRATVIDERLRKRCASRRGATGGRWEKNLHAAPLMQYYGLRWSGVHRPMWGFTYSDQLHEADESSGPRVKTKFRPPSTYVWRDEAKTEDECGPILPLNRDEFCDTAYRLGLDRILFVGDSLTLYQGFALLKQVGAEEPASSDGGDGWMVTQRCIDGFQRGPKKGRRRVITIQFVRNDWLADESSPLVPKGVKAKAQLRPWMETYLSMEDEDASAKTLLVVNSGAHYAGDTVPPYEQVIDAFLRDVGTKLHRPNDIVVVRTTPAGHPSCEKADRPYASHEEFEEARKNVTEGNDRASRLWQESMKRYGWDVYGDMNAHVREAVGRYNAKESDGGGPAEIHLLDVTSMTELRPDGHIGGPDNLDPWKKKTDCLHYTLPGPVDWWNNLMFANLADLPSAPSPTPEPEGSGTA